MLLLPICTRVLLHDNPVCSVNPTITPSSRSNVQRFHPSGGPEQTVATSSAVSLPDSGRPQVAAKAGDQPEHRYAVGTERRFVEGNLDLALSEAARQMNRAAGDSHPSFTPRQGLFLTLDGGTRAALVDAERRETCGAQAQTGANPAGRATRGSATRRSGSVSVWGSTVYGPNQWAQARRGRHAGFFRLTPPSVHHMVLTLERVGLISR